MPDYPTNPAFEAAVIANADDDTPRLVYADWLDEHGDPDRATFIRTQCALWDKNPADEDYVDLIEPRSHICDLMRQRWAAMRDLPKEVMFVPDTSHRDSDGAASGYHRGFPYFVHTGYCAPAATTTYWKRLVAALNSIVHSTTLRGLKIGDSSNARGLRTVLGNPISGYFSALTLTNQDPDTTDSGGTLPVLLSSPICGALRWLELSNVRSATDSRLLARTKAFCQLRRFGGGLECAAKPTSEVISSDWFGSLTRINLNLSTENAPTAICGLAHIPNLHTLELSRLSQRGGVAFAKANVYPALSRLRLEQAAICGNGVKSLAKAKLPRLAVLELLDCGLTDADAVQLARSPIFDGLRVLHWADPIGNKGLKALADSACAPQLRHLILSVHSIGKTGLDALARKFPNLTSLTVFDRHSSIDQKELTRFLKHLAAPELRYLVLSSCVDDQCAKAIAGNHTFTELRSLDLYNPAAATEFIGLTTKGLVSLITSRYLQNLERLVVSIDNSGLDVTPIRQVLAAKNTLPALRNVQLTPFLNHRFAEVVRMARPGVFVH
jgi:uncharacterized protein (TIGR02996 family)